MSREVDQIQEKTIYSFVFVERVFLTEISAGATFAPKCNAGQRASQQDVVRPGCGSTVDDAPTAPTSSYYLSEAPLI